MGIELGDRLLSPEIQESIESEQGEGPDNVSRRRPQGPTATCARPATTVIAQKTGRMRIGGHQRVLDMFAGCGGLALGFQAAGFNIVPAVEMVACRGVLRRPVCCSARYENPRP